jgi:hypothetical protein
MEKQRDRSVRTKLQATSIAENIAQYQQTWKKHVVRIDEDRLPLLAFVYHPSGSRDLVRPKRRWKRPRASSRWKGRTGLNVNVLMLNSSWWRRRRWWLWLLLLLLLLYHTPEDRNVNSRLDLSKIYQAYACTKRNLFFLQWNNWKYTHVLGWMGWAVRYGDVPNCSSR